MLGNMTVCRFGLVRLSSGPLLLFCPPNIPFLGGNTPFSSSVVFMELPITGFYPFGHRDRMWSKMGQLDHIFPKNWLLRGDTQTLESNREASWNIRVESSWEQPSFSPPWDLNHRQHWDPPHTSLFWLRLLTVGICCLHQWMLTLILSLHIMATTIIT